MAGWSALLLLLVATTASTASDDAEVQQDFVQLFEEGKQDYLDEAWSQCIEKMRRSSEAFKTHKKALVRCRIGCKKEAELAEPLSRVDVEDLKFFDKKVRTTLCLLKCTKENNVKYYKQKVLDEYDRLIPYDYMQLCYFQRNMLTQAADAAFTFLVANPNHDSRKKSFEFYLNLPEVDKNDISNLEAPKYVSLYVHGVDMYEKEDFSSVIQYFEESLVDYLQNEEECRAYCEGPFDQGWFPDFTPSIANHFTYNLKCKTNCSYNLNNLNGERHNDLLPSHYHYLQISYFRVGKLKEACEAAMSYLLFFPGDEEMLDNIKYYKALPKATPEFFYPREEAIQYVERIDYEWKILDFITKEFSPTTENKKGDEGEIQNEENDVNSDDIPVKKLTVGAEAKRKIEDHFYSEQQCQLFLDLAERASIEDDGYDESRMAPKSGFEIFSGLSLSRAALMVARNLLDVKALEDFISLSERTLATVKSAFNLPELYFSFTHLVCRTAIAKETFKGHMSHDIHADNCINYPNGTCSSESPAFSWRHFSAIVYLNNDFEGGELVFVSNDREETIEEKISPTCGRIVMFSAGPENLHGVLGVVEGKRCALGLWFTELQEHEEMERILAKETVQMVKEEGKVGPELIFRLESILF